MGILGRNNPQKGQRNGTTVIAAGTELVGDLALTDALHIDGRVRGSLQSKADVSIGEKGRFEGDVSARRVLVSGALEGNVEAERLEIVSGGRVDGDVRVAELVIESGGRFNGSSEIRGRENEPRRLTHETQTPAAAEPSDAGAEADEGAGGRLGSTTT